MTSRSTPTPARPAMRVGRAVTQNFVTPPRSLRKINLPITKLDPIIRIAHTLQTPLLRITTRIIFDHELVYIHHGSGWLHLQPQGSIELARGSLLLIPPFTPHRFDCQPHQGDICHTAVHFDLSPNHPGQSGQPHLRKPYTLALSHGLALPAHLQLASHNPMADQFTQIVRAWRSSGPLDQLRASHMLQGILLHLLQTPAANTSSPLQNHRSAMEKVITWLHENHHRQISLEDMATVAQLSRAHFIRIFTRWTGSPPAHYLQRTRITHAARLLAMPDALPLKQIARQTGFQNPYHFSRVFRRIQGSTPTQFRQSVTGQAVADHPAAS